MNKTMETFIKWTALVIISVSFFCFLNQSEKQELNSKSYDKCIEAMQKAIPDPNDNSRASFLENCQK